jgi:hypothetical protein
MNKGVPFCLAAFAVAVLTGCGATKEPTGCQYDFEATVRSGPSAPKTLHGTLTMVQPAANLAIARLDLASGGPPIFTSGQIDGKNITLRFWLADGTSIIGTGPMEHPTDQCKGQMQGSLTGPVAGDTGDWLVNPNITPKSLLCGPFGNGCYFASATGGTCSDVCIMAGITDTPTLATCITNCVNTTPPGTFILDCMDKHVVTSFFQPDAGCYL